MKLELLYFNDCPNWKIAAERLDNVAGGRGSRVERRLTTPEAAESPFRSLTILVDAGPFARGRAVGLACCATDPRRPG